jgi:4-amino-4-deoxy-L-arabinose transferase-like glycosyltransferase
MRFAHGNLDALLVFLFLASFYFYLLSSQRKIFATFCGISLGLGFLVKGWFLGLYPALIISLWTFFVEKKLPRNLPLIVLFTFISSSWYFTMGAVKFGKPFINWYLLNPAAGLFGSPLSSFSLRYFQDLVRDIGFWWIPVVFFIFKFKKLPSTQTKILAVLLISILVFIFPLNFLSEKLGWYNLPAYPQVAILIAYALGKLYQKSAKITSVLITIVLIAQIYNVARIENIYPDRSKVGADLGKFAKNIISQEETVILDDHDFTAFLFYSNHQMVYETSQNGGKVGEWWTLKYDDLPQFIENNPKTWIVTPDTKTLKFKVESLREEMIYNGYHFLQF